MARLNDLLGETLKTILDLPRYYDELAGGLKGRVADDFAKYGLELVDFLIGAITPPEEVQKMIDERAGMGAIGDMQRYMAFKAARGIEAAANNPGEAGNAAGLGLGAGIGMMMPRHDRGRDGRPGPRPGAAARPRAAAAGAVGGRGHDPVPEVPGRGARGDEVLRHLRRRPCPRPPPVAKCQAAARAGLEVLRQLRHGRGARRPPCARSARRRSPPGAKFCGNCGQGLG